MTRGEMWWVETPEGGRRSRLILTRAAATDVLNRLHCVPATRSVRFFPTEVRLDGDDGMPQVCALTLDNIRPLPKAALRDFICTRTTSGCTRSAGRCPSPSTASELTGRYRTRVPFGRMISQRPPNSKTSWHRICPGRRSPT